MTNTIYKQIKQHITDGMLLPAARILRTQERDAQYTELYCRLQNMAFKMAQNIGPLSHDIYVEILMLSFPLIK